MSKLDCYRDYLHAQGFHPQAHDDFVSFRHEGGTYVLSLEDDQSFLRLVFPNFWPIGSPEERSAVLESAAAVNSATRVVKVFPFGADTQASVEVLLPSPDAFRDVFPQALQMLKLGAERFFMAMALARAGAWRPPVPGVG